MSKFSRWAILAGLLLTACQAAAPTPSPESPADNPSPVTPANTLASPAATPPPATPTPATPAEKRVSDKDGMTMVFVPAGEFAMGSEVWDEEKPIHTVYLDGYWIDQTEVTNAMYERFKKVTDSTANSGQTSEGWVWSAAKGLWQKIPGASWRTPAGPGSSIEGLGDHPVVQVSWDDAAAYCEWVGRRLPTEAEWEKAARGTDMRTYPWGNDDPSTGNLLNFADSASTLNWADLAIDDGYAFTAPVESYPAGASPYGALDMAGNVWEWVSDRYTGWYYLHSKDSNPPGPVVGDNRVLRGGSWFNDLRDVRTSYRSSAPPGENYYDLGFRCSLEDIP